MSNHQGLNSPATPSGAVRSLRRNKEVFYKVVWPGLAAEGWTKIDASESMNGKPIFVVKVDPTVMGLREGQKGEDFYDEEEAVVARLLERRNEVESAIADSFLAKVSTPSRVAKGEMKTQREAPWGDGAATKEAVPKIAGIRGKEEASQMIIETKDDSKSDGLAETAGEAALESTLMERKEEASPMEIDRHDEPVNDAMKTPGESITPAKKDEASQMIDTPEEPANESIETPGESITPAKKEEACQVAIDAHAELENDAMETLREPSTPVESTEESQMAIDTHDEPDNDPKSDDAKEMAGGASIPVEKEDTSQMVIDTHDETENGANSDCITEAAGEAVLKITPVEKEAAPTTLHTHDEPADDAKSDCISETAGGEEKAMSASQILEEPGPSRETLENEQAIGDKVAYGKTKGGKEEALVERVTEPKLEPIMQEASQQPEGGGQQKDGGSSAKEAEEAGSAKKADQDKDEESSDRDLAVADSAKKAGQDEDSSAKDSEVADSAKILGQNKDEESSAKDSEEADLTKKADQDDGSSSKNSQETSPTKKASQDKGEESSDKESEETPPAKRERRRPQRAAVKNKKERAKNMGGREGKAADDVSDRDGSDYHSSDESQQGRKRKRRAAPATPPGRGRGRGRPRGRPRRKPKAAPSPKRGATPPRGRKPRQPSIILDGWKDGGKNFPKKISQVGPDFNATSIEPAGTWKDGESKIYCEQIWDPVVAEEKVKGESIDFLAERGVPHNKREAAMVGFAEVGYDAERFDNEKIVDKVTTKDGSEWTDEERQKYHTELFRLRKDVRAVSKSIGKSMNSCFAYYLGTFKKSDDYRLLKSVCYQERLRRLMEAEHDPDACAVCGDGGNLLICDGCEGEYHMECLRPALKNIPEGSWKCDECTDRAFIAAKDSLIRNGSLFERLPGNHKAGGNEEEGDSSKDAKGDGNGSLRVQPTAPVLEIFSRFAQNISAAFTEGALNGA